MRLGVINGRGILWAEWAFGVCCTVFMLWVGFGREDEEGADVMCQCKYNHIALEGLWYTVILLALYPSASISDLYRHYSLVHTIETSTGRYKSCRHSPIKNTIENYVLFTD